MSFSYEKHKLYPKSIIIRRISGDISYKEMLDSWNYISNNLINDTTTIGLINDLNECTLNMSLDEFWNMINFMRKNEVLKKIKIAVVTTSPKTIIFPMLAEQNIPDIKIKPFSTFEAAEAWILE